METKKGEYDIAEYQDLEFLEGNEEAQPDFSK